jgi:DNA-binding transcriptional MerR regulator
MSVVSEVPEIPDRRSYKLREVCRYTDTQPYVLRFWESEFSQLSPGRGQGGQAVYTRRDIDLILRIKQLLYEEEQTLDGARQILAREAKKGKPRGRGKKPPESAPPAEPSPAGPDASGSAGAEEKSEAATSPARRAQDTLEFDTVPRERYEDAVEEVSHLRFELKETEARVRKLETQLERARTEASEHRDRCRSAADRLEKVLELFD